jgi:hypothetical protein
MTAKGAPIPIPILSPVVRPLVAGVSKLELVDEDETVLDAELGGRIREDVGVEVAVAGLDAGGVTVGAF